MHDLKRACAFAYLLHQWHHGFLGDKDSGLRERFHILRRIWPALTGHGVSKVCYLRYRLTLAWHVLCRWRKFYDYAFAEQLIADFVDYVHERDLRLAPEPPPIQPIQQLQVYRTYQQQNYLS